MLEVPRVHMLTPPPAARRPPPAISPPAIRAPAARPPPAGRAATPVGGRRVAMVRSAVPARGPSAQLPSPETGTAQGQGRSVAGMCPACDGWPVESGTVATGRMRVCVGLTVAGAVLLMLGVITILVGHAMRLKEPHGWQSIITMGEIAAACGLGCGLALLIVMITARPGRAGGTERGQWDGRERDRGNGAARGQTDGPIPHRDAYDWDGPDEVSWRNDSADEWLSPLRNSGVPRPVRPAGRSRQGQLPEFSAAQDYADDGWSPDQAPLAPAADRPPGRPDQVWQGGHRPGYRTGPQPGYGPDPQQGYREVPGPGSRMAPQPGFSPQLGYGAGPQPGYELGSQPGYGDGPQNAPPQNRYWPGPQPGNPTGPQPGYPAGPQSRYPAGPQPGYGDGAQNAQRQNNYGPGPQSGYPAGPQPGYPAGPQSRYPAGPQPGYGDGAQKPPENRYVPGPQPGYPTGPQPPDETGPRNAEVLGSRDEDQRGPRGPFEASPKRTYLTTGTPPGEGGQPGYPAGQQNGYLADRHNSSADERNSSAEQRHSYPAEQPVPASVWSPLATDSAADDTTPLPVILHAGPAPRPLSEPRPGGAHRRPGPDYPDSGYQAASPGYRPAGPDPDPDPEYRAAAPAYRPADPGYSPAGPAQGPAGPERQAARPDPALAAVMVPPAQAQAKLDQIKDLYVTAEAIGEDALVKHFEEVSRRQRELIREYFEQSGFRANAAARNPGTGPWTDEAQLPS
jgi:hypothetical protein